MRNTLTLTAVLATLVLASGCGGGGTGFLIKPVPLDDRLHETTIAQEPGWAVSDKIAIIDVDGLILNDRTPGLFNSKENPVSLFIEQFDKAQADPDVRGVVIRINSPGGGVTASDIMYHRVLKFKQARPGVPVIACIEDLGASGAYYIACGCDCIFAHPTSVTGSIGVVVQTVSFKGTMDMIGVKAKAITSGEYKDMLSPLKPLDDKDAALVKIMVDELYGKFVNVVATGRKMPVEQVRKLADGRVYTADQALANHLVDSLGYMDDALLATKKASGATKVKVVMYHRPLGYRANAYSAAPQVPAAGTQINMVNFNMGDIMSMAQPRFLYIWNGALEK